MAELGSRRGKRPEASQRVPCSILPGLVVEVRSSGLPAAQLFRSVGALRCENDTFVGGFDHNRLMARRMAGCRQQTNPLGDLLVTSDEPQPVLRDSRPVRHCVEGRRAASYSAACAWTGAARTACWPQWSKCRWDTATAEIAELASPIAPSASASDVNLGLYHSSIAGLPHPMPVSTRTTPSGCRMTHACTGNGSNVACSGCHSGQRSPLQASVVQLSAASTRARRATYSSTYPIAAGSAVLRECPVQHSGVTVWSRT